MNAPAAPACATRLDALLVKVAEPDLVGPAPPRGSSTRQRALPPGLCSKPLAHPPLRGPPRTCRSCLGLCSDQSSRRLLLRMPAPYMVSGALLPRRPSPCRRSRPAAEACTASSEPKPGACSPACPYTAARVPASACACAAHKLQARKRLLHCLGAHNPQRPAVERRSQRGPPRNGSATHGRGVDQCSQSARPVLPSGSSTEHAGKHALSRYGPSRADCHAGGVERGCRPGNRRAACREASPAGVHQRGERCAAVERRHN